MSDCLPPKYDLVLQYSLYYTLHIFILMFNTPWKYRDVTKDNFFDRVKKFIYFKYKMSSFFTSNIKNFSISLWWSWEFYFIYETIIYNELKSKNKCEFFFLIFEEKSALIMSGFCLIIQHNFLIIVIFSHF